MPKDTSTATSEKIEIETRDGAILVGQLYLPDSAPVAAVVLCGATAVPQGYYRHFAHWLAAEKGIACLTFDYRDMGLSAQGHVARSQASMADWGIIDAEAVRMHMAAQYPDIPLWLIGHSLGTMMIPLQRNIEQIDRIIGVASGHVHHLDHPWPYRALALMFWFGFGPVLTALLGYMPGKALRIGEDLPANAYWQWRKWCTTRGFFREDVARVLPAWRPENLPDDMRFLAISDDDLCPEVCVQRLARTYNQSVVTVIDPSEHGLSDVGHLSIFQKRNKVLWPHIIAQKETAPLGAVRGERLTTTQAGLVTAASFRI